MRKETRVYLADLSKWHNPSKDVDNVIECAEEQGGIYSLQWFTTCYNNNNLVVNLADSNIVMATAIVEDGIVKESWV